MSNTKQIKDEILELNDKIEYLEGKMEYYRVQLADAYLKVVELKAKLNKDNTKWEDGAGY